jgi:hypothetical protein
MAVIKDDASRPQPGEKMKQLPDWRGIVFRNEYLLTASPFNGLELFHFHGEKIKLQAKVGGEFRDVKEFGNRILSLERDKAETYLVEVSVDWNEGNLTVARLQSLAF